MNYIVLLLCGGIEGGGGKYRFVFIYAEFERTPPTGKNIIDTNRKERNLKSLDKDYNFSSGLLTFIQVFIFSSIIRQHEKVFRFNMPGGNRVYILTASPGSKSPGAKIFWR